MYIFNSLGHIRRSGIAGYMVDSNSTYNILRNCLTVFYSSCTILHFHQKQTRVTFSPHPRLHLLLSFFLIVINFARGTAILKSALSREFPGGPEVRILGFDCTEGPGSTPGRGAKIPASCVALGPLSTGIAKSSFLLWGHCACPCSHRSWGAASSPHT